MEASHSGRPSRRGRVTIRFKIISGYAVILACLAVSILIVFLQLSSVQEETEYVTEHDISVMNLTNAIEKDLLDMETGQRGFILTGEESYLEPYRSGFSQWQNHYSELLALVSDNPSQTKVLELARGSIEQWLTITMPIIEAKQNGDEAAIREFYAIDRGKQNMDQLRGSFDAFRQAEQKLAKQRLEMLDRSNSLLRTTLLSLFLISIVLSGLFGWLISRSIVRTIGSVTESIAGMADSRNRDSAQLRERVEIRSRDEIADLAAATNRLLDEVEGNDWKQRQALAIGSALQQTGGAAETQEAFLRFASEALRAPFAALYAVESLKPSRRLKLACSVTGSGDGPAGLPPFIEHGEGLVGRCLAEQRMSHYDMPESYVKIASAFGEANLPQLLLVPAIFEGRTLAVLEAARFEPFTPLEQDLALEAAAQLALALHRVHTGEEIRTLLQESQSMTEELQQQAEELQTQQEELAASNEQLGRQARLSEEKSQELQSIQQELTLYAAELERSSRYKNEFMANMSHELRTPLNSMLILSQMLAENAGGGLSPKEEEFAKVIHSAGEDLLALINDILDLSKIEAGKMEISLEPLNLSELPALLQASFRAHAERTGLEYAVIRRLNVPDRIVSDEQRLMQILKNLLSNAFKFTQQGGVTVTISQASEREVLRHLPSQAGRQVVAFEVRDTGIGIDPSKLDLIFEAFRQADGTTSRQFGGTGLGLSISRQLAGLLQGCLHVESQPGLGSAFTLYVPSLGEAVQAEAPLRTPGLAETAADLDEAAPPGRTLAELPGGRLRLQPAAVEEPRRGSRYRGMRVLVVDDDIRNVYSLTSFLEQLGIEVLTATNGREALDALDACGCDLILMDMMMPVLDGYDTIREIRSSQTHRGLPIIALTAKAMPQDRELCLQAGATDYITKPLQLERLSSLLEVWLPRRKV
ncbi:response regulator [Paenibacillus albicereus]|uniref:Circadian input-output histidine kinase CikA n=1 Tax=Paenibacillus albicereus TaxID=2726185 RepID=A0A6H2H1C1_9BACL|nr:CHASE3 domain-containing protein [Paenibacillus albicereus]QJC53452.1 response regulator [Paenibacillus albicereus]